LDGEHFFDLLAEDVVCRSRPSELLVDQLEERPVSLSGLSLSTISNAATGNRDGRSIFFFSVSGRLPPAARTA
jgi:hypothetical protein